MLNLIIFHLYQEVLAHTFEVFKSIQDLLFDIFASWDRFPLHVTNLSKPAVNHGQKVRVEELFELQ